MSKVAVNKTVLESGVTNIPPGFTQNISGKLSHMRNDVQHFHFAENEQQ
jgi:hypothetical protein